MNIKLNKNSKLFILFFLLVSLPLAVYLAVTIQRPKPKAGPGPAVLQFTPPNQTIDIGEASTANIFISPNGADVSAAELVIGYDSNIINVSDIVPGNYFTDPVEILKDLSTPGRIHYVLAFPLGSNSSSTNDGYIATINFSGLSVGNSQMSFDEGTYPSTIIADSDAQNVFDYGINGSVDVTGPTMQGARLYFSPTTPQSVGDTFDLTLLADTNNQEVDGVDAVITFDPTYLEVLDLEQGTEPGFTSYPFMDFQNDQGTIFISATVGAGEVTNPPVGSALNIGTIRFRAHQETSSTRVVYSFVPEGRNDSNIVLSGTLQTQDPVDILESVSDAYIQITSLTPTATPTPAPPYMCSLLPSCDTLPLGTKCVWVAYSPSSNLTCDTTCAETGRSYPYRCNESGFEYETNYIFSCCDYSDIEPTPTGPVPTTPPPTPTIADFRCELPDCDSNIPTGTRCVWVAYSDLFTCNTTCAETGRSYPYRCNDIDYDYQSNYMFSCCNYIEGGPTATPTPLPTSLPSENLILKISFQGRLYQGANNSKTVTLRSRATQGDEAQDTFDTNSDGEGMISILPGDYLFLIKAPGYLAQLFGSSNNPLNITPDTDYLDLSSLPLVGGDFNGDGVVNEVDYTLYLLPNFLTNDPLVDLDGSGVVNSLDFAIMRSNWSLTDDTF